MFTLLLAIPAAIAQAEPAAAPDAEARGKFLKSLEQASELNDLKTSAKVPAEQEEFYRKFSAVIQEIAPHFESVAVEQASAPKKFIKVTLNANKKKIDAVRFKTPEGDVKSWNMKWEFIMPTGAALAGWYILPEKGEMKGFDSFNASKDFKEEGAELPASNKRTVQSLKGLKPNTEYILWFAFKDDAAVEFNIRIGLTAVK
jgi:hypothetical protein